MTYDEFLKVITEKVQEHLGRQYIVGVEKVLKYNGVMMDALSMSRIGEKYQPTLYLNTYYEIYQEGTTMDEILNEILEVYQWNERRIAVSGDEVKNFEEVQDNIFYILINAEQNRGLLEKVPHILYLDLAIAFYVYADAQEKAMSMMIYKELLEKWEITEQDLYELAKKNTPRLFPAEIKSMNEVMKKIAKQYLEKNYSEEEVDALLESKSENLTMYVLINEMEHFGAGCVLYEGVLKGFADDVGQDLYVIPSSLHETIIIPAYVEVDDKELLEMLIYVNATVDNEDFLSNELYRFSRADAMLIPANIGKMGFSS